MSNMDAVKNHIYDLTLHDIDREVAEIISNGKSKTKVEITGPLSLLSRDSLVEARHDLYQLCKNRLCGDDEDEETAVTEASWLTDGWNLKERRSPKIMGDDIYELWQYAGGNCNVFPKELLIKKAKSVPVPPTTQTSEAANMAVMREQISSLMGLIEEHKVKIQNIESAIEAKIRDMKIEHTKEITQLNGTIASLNKKIEGFVQPSTSKRDTNASSAKDSGSTPNGQSLPVSESSSCEPSQPPVIIINDSENASESTIENTGSSLSRVEWPSLPSEEERK